MRLTTRKAEGKQGRVLVEKEEDRPNGRLRYVRSRRFIYLSVLVEFLNQRYDENGIAVWQYDTSLLAFIYRPFLDVQGLTKEQLIDFYAETKRVQLEIRRLLTMLVNGDSNPLVEKFNDTAGSELRNSVLDLVYDLYYAQQLDKLAVCQWCDQFFGRPHPLKDRHCSDKCRRLVDQRLKSGARRVKREQRAKQWLIQLLTKPIATVKQRQAIDSSIKTLFRDWKEFRKWKSEVQYSSDKEIFRSLSTDQRKIAMALMGSASAAPSDGHILDTSAKKMDQLRRIRY